MDFIDLGCAVLRTSFFESFMAAAGYFGHGWVGVPVSLLFLAHGYAYDNQNTKRAGLAILIALVIAGTAAQVLKELVQWPRPKNTSSQGFPSGHTSAAFAFASVLSAALPAFAPVFYLLAVLTAVSRLYFRAHFTWDVCAGAALGLAVGIPTARKLLARAGAVSYSPARFAGWTAAVAVSIAGVGFFAATEQGIRVHRVTAGAAQNIPAVATLDFGTPQARSHLRHGWSVDEQWTDVNRSVVWASGLASELTLDLPSAQDYRLRMHLHPYSPTGPACQAVEIRVNDGKIAKVLLEQGWHAYEFAVPRSAVRAGSNSLQFFYNYAEPPKLRRQNPDERSLSVAFDRLDVLPAR